MTSNDNTNCTMPTSCVPSSRIQSCNEAPINPGGEYVLYWMIGFRRTTWNFSLQRAIEWAVELKKAARDLRAVAHRLSLGQRSASSVCHRRNG